MEKLVLRSSSLIAKAVENAAEKNAILFSKTVQLIRNATKTQQMNETEFAKILQGKLEVGLKPKNKCWTYNAGLMIALDYVHTMPAHFETDEKL